MPAETPRSAVSDPLRLPLRASGPVSQAALGLGLSDLRALAEHVRRLPYGRPEDREEPVGVLRDQRGTCSGKHQLLARAARECGQDQVLLVVGVYRMGPTNTPGVAPILRAAGVSWIPEAHCYLAVDGRRYDFTGLPAGAKSPFDTLMSEYEVMPNALVSTKRRVHEEAIAAWARRTGRVFRDAWALRESCIAALGA